MGGPCYASRLIFRILLVLAALLAAGCGYVGEPQPPLANVPSRVSDLTVVQRGARMVAQFTVPRMTTEGMPIKSPLHLDLRIGPGGDPFREDDWAAGATPWPEGPVTNGSATYEIPIAAWTGKQVVLGARVAGTNGKLSGWSNFVTVSVVAPPEPPADVRAEAVANGVRLTWRSQGAAFRIFRGSGNENFVALADTAQPPWTDTSTQFGKSYTYRIETIIKLGDNRQAESDPSVEISIAPKDIFPPAVPTGLHATATPNSIELSWEANTEPDLAGYRIYRAAPGGGFEKIADTPALPSYSDHGIEHGRAYRYAISAVDQAGNESARSTPAEATSE